MVSTGFTSPCSHAYIIVWLISKGRINLEIDRTDIVSGETVCPDIAFSQHNISRMLAGLRDLPSGSLIPLFQEAMKLISSQTTLRILRAAQ